MSELIDKLAARLERALTPEMDRIREIVQERISVPVERRNGKVIRSKRGEPPRRDKGDLYTSASAQTVAATQTVLGSVSVDTPYARTLVRDMDRPIFGPVLQDNKTAIVDALRVGVTDRS